MSDELRETQEKFEALHDRLQAELDHWGQLCERFTELRSEIARSQRILTEALQDSGRISRALRERIEADQDSADWWKL